MPKLKFIPQTDLDYVELYSEELRENNSLFAEQKKLINSQIKSSVLLFSRKFGKKNFKEKAREYLKERGLIDSKNN